MVEYFGPRIKRAARNYACRHLPGVDQDDLAQNGYIAMLRLARRYDPSRGVPLGAYLRSRLNGTMADTLRAEARQSKRDKVSGDGGFEEDASHETKVDPKAQSAPVGEAGAQTNSLLALLSAVSKRALTPRQIFALRLLYFHQLTMKQVGAILGVGESRISQIHGDAMNRLRRQLELQGIRQLNDLQV